MTTTLADLALLDQSAVKQLFGIKSNSTLLKRQRQELLTKPIVRGQKKFWPTKECMLLTTAEIGGQSDTAIQALTMQLNAQRAATFQQLKAETTIH